MSLTLLAVVGGTLAFKAKYHNAYCVAAIPESGICVATVCPNLLINSTTINGVAPFLCTTTPVAGDECPVGLGCAMTSTKLIRD